MGWWMVVYWIASMALSAMLAPKPKVENAKAANPNDANFPTASSSNTLTVVWGKVRVRTPNVTWYGDFKAVPIVRTSTYSGFFGFGKKTVSQVVGYKYYWGQQLVLCHGIVTLHKLWADERMIWSGTSTGGEVTINQGTMYGGEDMGGGIEGAFMFYPGDQVQLQDTYLTAQLGLVPAYRGVAHLVWVGPSGAGVPFAAGGWRYTKVHPTDMSYVRQYYTYTAYRSGGYIGTGSQPQPISAEVSRYPHQLAGSYHIVGEDANPAEIIYELLTTDSMGEDGFGMGLSSALVDLTAFNAAAVILYSEGFGLSMVWDQPSAVEDLIGDICKVIDAVCYRDFRTGKYVIKLIRAGYSIPSLPILDETNILSVDDFSQTCIEGTTNEVVLTYNNRVRGYKKSVVQAQDMANMRLQRDVNSQAMTYLGITGYPLADRVANRELMVASTALAGAEVIVNREAYAYGPGDLFVFNWPDLGISGMVMRISKSAIGMPKANRIRLTLIQDVFSLGSVAYTSGKDVNWTDPIPSPAVVVTQKLIELPYFMNTDETVGKFLAVAQRPNVGCITYELWMKLVSATEGRSTLGSCQSYTPSSVLVNAYGLTDTVDETGTLVLAAALDMTGLIAFTEDLMRQGGGLFYFATTGEWCAYRAVEGQIDGTFKLYGVWRGLFDTVPVVHSAGERVYLVYAGAMAPDYGFSQSDSIDVRLTPAGPRGIISEASATSMTLTFTAKNTKPLPPGRMLVNSMVYPPTITGGVDVIWEHRNRLTAASTVKRQDELGEATAEGTYEWKLTVNGTIQETASGLTGKTWVRGGPYTPAQRIQDSPNGNYMVEVLARQTTGAGSSLWNSTRPFQMTGFGMCFGQQFGGVL